MDRQSIENYEPSNDEDPTKDFTGRILMPHNGSDAYNEAFWLRNPATGFTAAAGDLIVQMGTEFTTARYIASVVQALEVIATPECPKPRGRWADLQDSKRWN